MLDGGGHLDAEGVGTNPYAEFFCGAATLKNAAAVQSITTSWINHVFTWSSNDITGPVGMVIPVGGTTARVIGVSSRQVA